MLQSILYFISIICLVLSFIKIKKSNNKFNLILWLFISIILLFCYNVLVVYALSIFYIKSTLVVLSIVNFIISLLLFIKIKKEKSIQKYYIRKNDIIVSIILLIIVIVIGYFRFGFPFKIIYETCDPGTHFWTSMDFFRESILLNKADTAVDFSTRVFGSYVNVGITFKVFYPVVGYINLYAVYIAFDLFMLFLSGILFYFLVSVICKNNKFFVNLLSTILYLFGYPLNNMIFGFFYSGHTVILMTTLLIFFKLYEDKDISKKLFISLITILNITVCFTYYFFAPFVSLFIILYFIYKSYKKNSNKVINKDLIKTLIFTVLLPFILSILYFIIPYLGNEQYNSIRQLDIDGYFYNSGISNFLIFIPFVIYYIYSKIKEKNLDFECICTIALLFIIILFICLVFIGVVDQYYLSKYDYILWLVCFVILLKLFDSNYLPKAIGNIYMLCYVVLTFASVLCLEDKFIDTNELLENKRDSSNILDIYDYNISRFKYTNVQFTLEEIEMLKKLYDLGAENVVSNFIQSFNHQKFWLNAFFWNEKLDYPENELYAYLINGYFFDPLQNDYSTMNSNYKYYVVFYRDYSDNRYINYKDVIPFDVQRRWDVHFRGDFTINKISEYKMISRNNCVNCEFIDFNDGMIIIKN